MTDRAAAAAPLARLASLCDESGLTRAEIAGRVGTSQGNVSRLLSGRRDPSLSTVARVLAALGLCWADLDGPT